MKRQLRQKIGILFFLPTALCAQDFPGLGGAPKRFEAESSALLGPDYLEQKYGVKVKVFDDSRNRVTLSASTGHTALGPDLALSYPQLWSPLIGLSYSHTKSPQQSYGIMGSLKSPSNKPFKDESVLQGQVTGFYQMPSGREGSWFLFLNYSPRRSFLQGYPLPGVSYFMQSEDRKLTALWGVPFFVFWMPTFEWHVKASLLFPYLVSAEVKNLSLNPMSLAAGFEWAYSDFLLADRAGDKEQFFYDRKSLYLGPAYKLLEGLDVKLRGLYSWDQRQFKSKGFFSRDKYQRAGLEDSLQAELKIEGSF